MSEIEKFTSLHETLRTRLANEYWKTLIYPTDVISRACSVQAWAELKLICIMYFFFPFATSNRIKVKLVFPSQPMTRIGVTLECSLFVDMSHCRIFSGFSRYHKHVNVNSFRHLRRQTWMHRIDIFWDFVFQKLIQMMFVCLFDWQLSENVVVNKNLFPLTICWRLA